MENRTEMWPHKMPTRVGHILALINTFPYLTSLPHISVRALDFAWITYFSIFSSHDKVCDAVVKYFLSEMAVKDLNPTPGTFFFFSFGTIP